MFHKKYRLLLIIEAIVATLLFLSCFQKEEQIYAVQGEAMAGHTVESDGRRLFSGERLALAPGVYEIRMETHIEGEQAVFVQMRQDGTDSGALRNSGAKAESGCETLRFYVYVTDNVPDAYVFCRFSDADVDVLRQLAVYRTGIGNRLLFCGSVLFFALLDFLLWFRGRILSGEIAPKRQVVFWLLLAAVLIAYSPYLTDYIIPGDDQAYHLERIGFLKDTLQQGTAFPVRVQATWLYGHGYATSLFYGDLFLYFPACLMLAGFSVMTAYKIFVFAAITAGAWIGYHCLYRCVGDEYAALLGSVMYLLAPYRLYNLYNRAAIGEFLAMTFLPLVCCGMYLLYTQDTEEYGRGKWYLVWGMSALLQSHLITTEMTAMLMAVVCAVFWRRTFRKRIFFQLLEAVGLVLLINMWFWLPLLYMMRADAYEFQSVIQNEMMHGTELAGALQLLPSKGLARVDMRHLEPIQLGVGAVFLLLVCLLRRLGGRRTGRPSRFFAAFCALTLILSTRYIPWNAMLGIPVIGYLIGSWQFPFRWLALSSVLVAFFSAFFCLELTAEEGLLPKIAVGIAVFIVPLSAIYHVNDITFHSAPVRLYNIETSGTTGVSNGEWLLAGTDVDEIRYHGPVAEEGLTWRDYEKKGTSVDIFLENTSGEARYLELPLMGYRGYGIEIEEAEKNGASAPVIARERGAHNDLRIEVPGGYRGSIHVSYQGFAIFHVAEAVSLISILAILSGEALRRRKVRNEGECPGQ